MRKHYRRTDKQKKGYTMALFEEKEISLGGGNLEKFSIQELPKGKSLVFYFADITNRQSKEYGDFVVFEGLQLDINAAGVEKLIASSKGISFVPNTFLQNAQASNNLEVGRAYRIEKAWNKDDKFEDGKRAKGYGYKIFELSVDGETRGKLNEHFLAIRAGGEEL